MVSLMRGPHEVPLVADSVGYVVTEIVCQSSYKPDNWGRIVEVQQVDPVKNPNINHHFNSFLAQQGSHSSEVLFPFENYLEGTLLKFYHLNLDIRPAVIDAIESRGSKDNLPRV